MYKGWERKASTERRWDGTEEGAVCEGDTETARVCLPHGSRSP